MKYEYNLTDKEEEVLLEIAQNTTPSDFITKIIRGILKIHIDKKDKKKANKLLNAYDKLSAADKETIDTILGGV
jgi:hypothetical protein